MTSRSSAGTSQRFTTLQENDSLDSPRVLRWVALSLVATLFAMWAIHKGNTQDKPELYAAGLAAAFVAAGILFKVTADAQKRRR